MCDPILSRVLLSCYHNKILEIRNLKREKVHAGAVRPIASGPWRGSTSCLGTWRAKPPASWPGSKRERKGPEPRDPPGGHVPVTYLPLAGRHLPVPTTAGSHVP
jgi:hypothetical protein